MDRVYWNIPIVINVNRLEGVSVQSKEVFLSGNWKIIRPRFFPSPMSIKLATHISWSHTSLHKTGWWVRKWVDHSYNILSWIEEEE